MPRGAMLARFPSIDSSMPPQTHLFASHRYFIWAYETALRDECGYTSYQPVSTFPAALQASLPACREV